MTSDTWEGHACDVRCVPPTLCVSSLSRITTLNHLGRNPLKFKRVPDVWTHLRFSPPVLLSFEKENNKNNLSFERGPTRPRSNSRSHKGNGAMIPNDCPGKVKRGTMCGPVGPHTSFSCCIQVVHVVSKVLSCVCDR